MNRLVIPDIRFLLLVSFWAFVEGQGQTNPILHCLSCSNVNQSTISNCIYLAECAHECYTDTQLQPDGSWIKKFGCAQKTCISPTDVVGKRQLSSARREFCTKEICNTDQSHFQEPSATPCGDASANDCRDPTALASICSDCELAQYCRKSCGLCRDHGDTWYENLVLFDYDPVHKTCRHSPSVNPSICKSVTEQTYKVVPVVNNNTTLNHAHARHDYFILSDVDSYVNLNFSTNGEPLTNLQISGCKTTGLGRVDILLNNNTIVESYDKTYIWGLRWQIHKLNTNQYRNVRDYKLQIRKDSKILSRGHYWLSRIRLESVVIHHGHRGK